MLSLLEERHARQIRVGEVDGPDRLRRIGEGAAPEEPWPRSHHRMAPDVDVDSLDEAVDVGVGPAQIGKDLLGPLTPARPEETRTHGADIGIRERTVVSE